MSELQAYGLFAIFVILVSPIMIMYLDGYWDIMKAETLASSISEISNNKHKVTITYKYSYRSGRIKFVTKSFIQ